MERICLYLTATTLRTVDEVYLVIFGNAAQCPACLYLRCYVLVPVEQVRPLKYGCRLRQNFVFAVEVVTALRQTYNKSVRIGLDNIIIYPIGVEVADSVVYAGRSVAVGWCK